MDLAFQSVKGSGASCCSCSHSQMPEAAVIWAKRCSPTNLAHVTYLVAGCVGVISARPLFDAEIASMVGTTCLREHGFG